MQIWFSRSPGRLEVILASVVLIIVAFRFSHVIAAWSLEQGAHKLGRALYDHQCVYCDDSRAVRLNGGPGSRVAGCETMLADLRRSAAWQPSNGIAYYLLAKAQYQCQDLKGAIEATLNWLQLQSKDDPLYSLVSQILIESYMATDDKTDIETILRDSPHVTTVLMEQGDNYLSSGNLTLAREIFRLGTRVSQSTSSFYLRLGKAYQEEGNFDRGLSMYRAALELNTFHTPEDKSCAHFKHGEILLWTGRDVAQSIEDFNAATRIQPNNYSAHLLKGIAIYRYTKDPNAAQIAIKASIDIDPLKKEAYIALGNIYRDAGQTEAAKEAYLEVLERDPENKEAFQALMSLR